MVLGARRNGCEGKAARMQMELPNVWFPNGEGEDRWKCVGKKCDGEGKEKGEYLWPGAKVGRRKATSAENVLIPSAEPVSAIPNTTFAIGPLVSAVTTVLPSVPLRRELTTLPMASFPGKTRDLHAAMSRLDYLTHSAASLRGCSAEHPPGRTLHPVTNKCRISPLRRCNGATPRAVTESITPTSPTIPQ